MAFPVTATPLDPHGAHPEVDVSRRRPICAQPCAMAPLSEAKQRSPARAPHQLSSHERTRRLTVASAWIQQCAPGVLLPEAAAEQPGSSNAVAADENEASPARRGRPPPALLPFVHLSSELGGAAGARSVTRATASGVCSPAQVRWSASAFGLHRRRPTPAPEFMPTHNSALIGNRGRRPASAASLGIGAERGFTWLVRLALSSCSERLRRVPLSCCTNTGWLSGRVNRCQRHGAGELLLSAHSSGRTLPGGYRVPRCRKCRAEADALAAEIAPGKAGAIRSRAPRSTTARRGGPTPAGCRDRGKYRCAWEAGSVSVEVDLPG